MPWAQRKTNSQENFSKLKIWAKLIVRETKLKFYAYNKLIVINHGMCIKVRLSWTYRWESCVALTIQQFWFNLTIIKRATDSTWPCRQANRAFSSLITSFQRNRNVSQSRCSALSVLERAETTARSQNLDFWVLNQKTSQLIRLCLLLHHQQRIWPPGTLLVHTSLSLGLDLASRVGVVAPVQSKNLIY